MNPIKIHELHRGTSMKPLNYVTPEDAKEAIRTLEADLQEAHDDYIDFSIHLIDQDLKNRRLVKEIEKLNKVIKYYRASFFAGILTLGLAVLVHVNTVL